MKTYNIKEVLDSNRKAIIEDRESVLDNVAHELFNMNYFSEDVSDELIDKYYEFRKEMHRLIKSDFPDSEEFGNF